MAETNALSPLGATVGVVGGEGIPVSAIANVSTADADGTYGGPEATLINELKTKLNAALAALRTAGIISS